MPMIKIKLFVQYIHRFDHLVDHPLYMFTKYLLFLEEEGVGLAEIKSYRVIAIFCRYATTNSWLSLSVSSLDGSKLVVLYFSVIWLKNSNICMVSNVLWSIKLAVTDRVWKILSVLCFCHWIYTMLSGKAYFRLVFTCRLSLGFIIANADTNQQGRLYAVLKVKHCPYISILIILRTWLLIEKL